MGVDEPGDLLNLRRSLLRAAAQAPLTRKIDDLEDEEWVSRRVYVNEQGKLVDHDRPRPDKDHGGLSAFRGRLSPAEVARKVVGRWYPPTSDDGVRYARVGDLRQAGFTVVLAPTRKSPDHVRITFWTEWGDEAAALFQRCFTEPVWHDDPRRA